MEKLEKYDNFISLEKLNEGLFGNKYYDDFLDGSDSCAVTGGAVFLAFISIFLWISYFGSGANVTELGRTIVFWIAVLFSTPLTLIMGRELTRYVYFMLRSKFLLEKTTKKYEELRKIIKYYPDMEAGLNKYYRNLETAIKNNDRMGASDCIREIFKISKEIAKREKENPVVRDWKEEDEEKSLHLNLLKINDLLKKENLSDNLRMALTEIKKVIMHYEQSDEYPFNYISVNKLSENESNLLRQMGFGVFPTKDGEKDRILWKWK